ncbi:hypothetical protein SAMN04487962_1235 [Marinobacter segnicrescens]|uniref:Asparagine synthase n=1 Tax=Marinobacter segnicrescens TaxID=430453 RepID=A0A1I0H1N4_9GAMM|nr:hypothetical protein [Marinobacter segnicrescens]SET77402.1 hypothetical protein SAMN04487962_1235 [Marinobacter segnicrescens]
MMPNSFRVQIGEVPGPLTDDTRVFDNVSLEVRALNPRHISVQTSDQGFAVFMGEAHEKYQDINLSPAGTTLTYTHSDRTLTVKCDRLGTAILFWKRVGNGICLSNRLENLLDAASEPDWCSIQQYLHTGFTIGAYTFFKNIFQTEQNQELTVQVYKTGNIQVSSGLRAVHGREQPISNEALMAQIAERLSRRLNGISTSVLMMSAGWDSRTLLMEGNTPISGAYSHGDLSSREIGLARTLSGNERLDHLFSDVQSAPINNSLIDKMMTELGFGIFPIWYLAANNVQSWKNAPLMSGVLGELLGGHYGLMAWGSRRQKILSSMLLVSDVFIKEGRIRSMIDQYATPPKTHWFISDTGQHMLDGHRDETKQRCLEAINQCYNRTESWQRAIEEFNISHRGRQYILKQAQAASSTVGYSIPFADEPLTDLVRLLGFQHRVHNKANQRILKQKRPQLLNEPMAATLVAAKHPIVIQEVSRFIRVFAENMTRLRGKEVPKLGWFNYEHLYQGNILNEMVDSLKSDFWDRPKMHCTLSTNTDNAIDAGSTLDMICKIKTVDYYLQNASQTPT